MSEQETTFRRLKYALFELLRGYPAYRFFGKIESYIRESDSSLWVLEKDGIIEFASKKESKELNKKLTPKQFEMLKTEGKKEPVWYRLAPRGVDLAVSMINLENGEKILGYSKKTDFFTRMLTWFTLILLVTTIGMLFFAFSQAIISLWF